MKPKSCLTIAGSDPSGGAGIQGDLKTFCAHSVYGMAVITALTVQNTISVDSLFPVPPDLVSAQLSHLWDDIPWDVAKTGMLHSSETVRAVGEFYKSLSRKPLLVVDPVMVASSGDALASSSLVGAYCEWLFPVATLVTPNAQEANRFTGIKITTFRQFPKVAEALVDMGARAVLLKGGDLPVEDDLVHDLLQVADEDPLWFTHPRVSTVNSHGTGCALAASIASNLALGMSISGAVLAAREYVRQALVFSYSVGQGRPSINHLWKEKIETVGPLGVSNDDIVNL
jgi:hydroxymethylpyrimidine/phosphomethylpyrimidine kinase